MRKIGHSGPEGWSQEDYVEGKNEIFGRILLCGKGDSEMVSWAEAKDCVLVQIRLLGAHKSSSETFRTCKQWHVVSEIWGLKSGGVGATYPRGIFWA